MKSAEGLLDVPLHVYFQSYHPSTMKPGRLEIAVGRFCLHYENGRFVENTTYNRKVQLISEEDSTLIMALFVDQAKFFESLLREMHVEYIYGVN